MSGVFYTNVAVHGNDILLCGYHNGERIRERVPYAPYLFVPTTKQTKYRTLDGHAVQRINFETIEQARQFVKQYKDVDGTSVYGLTQFAYTFIFDTYKGNINYDPSLISVCTLDIEVDIANDSGFPDIQAADNEITLITISRNGNKVVFGCRPYNNTSKNVTYYQCKDEKALLQSFLEIWNSIEFIPDVVTGWNIELFDIPYTINRIIRVLGRSAANKLSPWRILNENNVVIMGKQQQVYIPVGIAVIDYMQAYKKFAYTSQEQYTLDHVCLMELGERKLDYGEYGSLAALQVENWQMYVDYNIRDVDLVERLDDKLKIIELIYAIAYDAKINFQDAFTTVRAWDVIIHNYLMERNIVVPQISVPEFDRGILGGYVKDPQIGMHEWVVSLDVNSLYPHIIMQYNISPETFAGWLEQYQQCWDKDEAERRTLAVLDGSLEHVRETITQQDIAVAANLTTYKRTNRGFLPSLMSKYYDERVIYKNKMIEAKKELEAIEAELRKRK